MSKLRSFLVVIGCATAVAWAGLRVHSLFAPSAVTGLPAPSLMQSLLPAPESSVDRNFTEIEPDLFMGGYVAAPPRGCEAVLNVCEIEDEYNAPHHKWAPIADAPPAPTREWLREAVDFVVEQRRKNRPTYIHCQAGISRSSMVTAAYLMQKNDWSRDEALAFIRRSRPVATPNPAFMELLKEWETR